MKAVPKKVSQAATRRIANTFVTQQVPVQAAIRSGRPLDAEEDNERKLAYIQKSLGVGRKIATSIANYEDPARLPLSPSQRAQAESLQGLTLDFLPVRFLDMARAASRSVARVCFPNRAPQGTGFMVSPDLFLTNHHVISSVEEARTYVLEFDFEEDASLNKVPVTRFSLDPERFFQFDPTDDLDFALVAVGPRVEGDRSLDEFGYLPLIDSLDKHMKAIFVNVIQHPEGRPKEIVVRENRILARTANTLIYGADTLKGSSGSPVFNDDWEVIALHHWAEPARALLDGEAELPGSGNEGIRLSSIIEQLKIDATRLPETRASLLRAALNPAFRHPSLYRSAGGRIEENTTLVTDTGEQVSKQNQPINADGTMTWSIPLTLSVRLGRLENGEISSSATGLVSGKINLGEDSSGGGVESFKFVPDPDYSNRRGYNPRFLGVRVSLPRLTVAQKKKAAKNREARPGDNPYEIKYNRFSLVMNKERRLPFFTAVNIDGGTVVKINRKTGEVTSVETSDEGAEAAEKWYNDGRIQAEEQSDQSLYDSPELKGYHRGHLVKRTDPSWGAVDLAIRGQADTFHFTNCAPQHSKFNPHKSRWAGLEDWITDGSDDENLRVTVFTGPVLRDNDPGKNYIQVPREFWKIVVRVEEGKLLATAVLADQGFLIEGEESTGDEGLPDLPERLPDEYQVTIRKIEELTGLHFGSLRKHDTFAGGPESMAEMRKIDRFEDIQIGR